MSVLERLREGAQNHLLIEAVQSVISTRELIQANGELEHLHLELENQSRRMIGIYMELTGVFDWNELVEGDSVNDGVQVVIDLVRFYNPVLFTA